MDRSLKEIIKEIGQEYDMEDEVIDQIIKTLQKEFYVKLKHMKNLSEDTWKSLDLPINLYYVLKELYQSALNEQPSQNPQPQNTINEIPQKKIEPKPKIENKKINNQNNINSQNDIIHDNLALIFTEIDNLDKSRQVFKQIHKIITNISQNPNEEKYRRFNIEKFLKAFNYNSITPFFLNIGFKKVDEYMYLIGDASHIQHVMRELNSFILANKIAESSFDPYKGSISSIGGNDEKIKKISNQINFEDLYYDEISRRNIIIKNTKVERNPKVYQLEKNYSLNKIINNINNNADIDLISHSDTDKQIIKKNLAMIKEKQNDRFTLKSRTRLEQLMKTPIYVKSDIRLKFPNEIILQGTFALYETVGDIVNFVKEYLRNKNEKFNISTTPPLKRYLKMDATIQEEKLFPSLLMYVNFESQYSGLDESKTIYIMTKMEFLDDEEEEEINTMGNYKGKKGVTWG